MSSSSFSSDSSDSSESSSSSSDSSSSSPNTPTFPSSALAAAHMRMRMRRHRRDAISLQAESEWETPAPTTTQAPFFSTGWSWTADYSAVPVHAAPSDELICPLAASHGGPPAPPSPSPSPFSLPHVVVDTSPLALAPTSDHQTDAAAVNSSSSIDTASELQATLARFAFPSTTRKHRRSGESIDHHPAPPPPHHHSALGGGGGVIRRCGTGPVKRAQCAHCEHARTSV